MDDQIILIRYGELSLKSEYVRNQFERTLIKNISNALKDADTSINEIDQELIVSKQTKK